MTEPHPILRAQAVLNRVPPWLLWVGALAVVVFAHVLTHGRMHIHYLDDAWTMSFAWTWMREGVAVDRVYRTGGALTFGYTQFLIYGVPMDFFGWTRSNALWISTALIFANAAVWYGICRGVGWPRERALVLAVALVAVNKFVESANLARPDALVLLFISLSLFCLIRRRWFLAALLSMAAVETHPIGVVGFFYQGAWLLHARSELLPNRRAAGRLLLPYGVGLAVGMALIYATRPELLSWQRLTGMAGRAGQVHGPSRSEFTWLDRHFKYHSHVELAVFLLAFITHLIRRTWRTDALPLLWLVAILLAALIIRRPNGFYVLMAFPALTVLAVSAWPRRWFLRAALLILLVSLTLRSVALFQERRDYDLDETIEHVVQIMPDDDLPIVGLDDFWFGFRDRRFIPANYAASFEALELDVFYLLDSSIKPGGLRSIRRKLGAGFVSTPLTSFVDDGGQRVTIERFQRRPDGHL